MIYTKLSSIGLVTAEKNQLTVMCTTHGERKLISIQCQNEFLKSKLDGQTDSHNDYSASRASFDPKSLKYCYS